MAAKKTNVKASARSSGKTGAKPSNKASEKRPRSEPTSSKTASRKQGKRADSGLELDPKRIAELLRRLQAAYPNAECALHHRNAWELLVATILSAQCTDARVNLVTPSLFKKFPTPQAFAQASLPAIEGEIRSTGFYHNKAKSISGAAKKLISDFGGKVPETMAELLTLPGVARKTGNVVLGVAFEQDRGRGGRHACAAALASAGAHARRGSEKSRRGPDADYPPRPLDRVFARDDPPRPADLHRPEAAGAQSVRWRRCATRRTRRGRVTEQCSQTLSWVQGTRRSTLAARRAGIHPAAASAFDDGCRTQNVVLEMQHPEFPGASRKENAGPRNSMAVAQNRAGRLCEPDDGFTGKGMEPVSRRLIFSLCQIDSSGTAYGIDPH